MQDAVALLRPDDLLHQQLPVRLVCQLIQAEQGLPHALPTQRHVPRRLIEIRLEAAVLNPRFLCEQIGKDIEHQLLGLVDIVQVAVEIECQGIAVFFHQSVQPRIVAAQILAV